MHYKPKIAGRLAQVNNYGRATRLNVSATSTDEERAHLDRT